MLSVIVVHAILADRIHLHLVRLKLRDRRRVDLQLIRGGSVGSGTSLLKFEELRLVLFLVCAGAPTDVVGWLPDVLCHRTCGRRIGDGCSAGECTRLLVTGNANQPPLSCIRGAVAIHHPDAIQTLRRHRESRSAGVRVWVVEILLEKEVPRTPHPACAER